MRVLFGIGMSLLTAKVVLKAIREHKRCKEYEEEYNRVKDLVDEINKEYETIMATGLNGVQVEVIRVKE